MCSCRVIAHAHSVSGKNDNDVAHYNYDIHEGILIIFGRYVMEKISNENLLYFSTSSN